MRFNRSRRDRLSLPAAICATAVLVGCGGALPETRMPAAEDPVVEATPTVVTATEASNVAELFERALSLLARGEAEEAARLFELVASADTRGTYAVSARFNAGLAWERAGNEAQATEWFETVIADAPAEHLAKVAAIRASRLLVRGEEWERLSEVADYLLARADLTDVERLEALGAKGLALAEAGDIATAERRVSEARDLVDRLGLGGGGQLPTPVAQVQFALGEIRKAKSERIVFVPLPADFADALERRCQGLLDAQGAYTDAMRSLDPHWAAMSGYRVGQLYQRLHQDISAIPPPRQADTAERRALFEAALRLRYRILLEKGLKMMEHTVLLGERTNEAEAWITRAREARDELLRALAEEKEALRRLPYSEEDLKRALDALEQGRRPSF